MLLISANSGMKPMLSSAFFCLLLSILAFKLTSASDDETRLLNSLLIGYNKLARPVDRTMEPIRVKLDVALREAVSLKEDLSQIEMLMWIKMIWRDEFLRWNPVDYGGITRAYISPDLIWTPDIVLYNAIKTVPENVQTDLKLIVSHEGDVTWVRPVTYAVTCKHEFRGDVWRCPLSFGSWAYHGLHLQLEPERDSMDIDDENFLTSDRFSLLGHSGRRHVKEYKCCPEPYIIMNYEVKLRHNIGMMMGRK